MVAEGFHKEGGRWISCSREAEHDVGHTVASGLSGLVAAAAVTENSCGEGLGWTVWCVRSVRR